MSLVDTTVITMEIAISEDDLKERLLAEALAGLGIEADNPSVTEVKVLRGENRKGGYRIRIRRDMSLDTTPRLAGPADRPGEPRRSHMTDEATVTKRRIEASVTQAEMNAHNTGGDEATAAADLMCAFILLTMKSGADPDRAREAMWDHAKAAVADFWPDQRIN